MMGFISTTQAARVLGWSYPTIRRFAEKHGQRLTDGGRWLIPAQVVNQLLQHERDGLEAKRREIDEDLAALKLAEDRLTVYANE